MFIIFFAGKSVLSKQRALSKASEEDDKEDGGKSTYYISLVGANFKGEPDHRLRVYDIMTKCEFATTRTSAEAIDVPKLMEYYNTTKTSDMTSSPNVYQLTEWFVSNHRNSHIILDEVPILPTEHGKILVLIVAVITSQIVIAKVLLGNLRPISISICFNHRNNIGVTFTNIVNSAAACAFIVNDILRSLIESAPNIPRHQS